MLSRNAKNILRILDKATDHRRSFNSLQLDLHLSWNDVRSACDALVSHRLAFYDGNAPEHAPAAILSEPGRHYAAYTAKQVGAYIVKSVVVPIIVALITTLVTHYLIC